MKKNLLIKVRTFTIILTLPFFLLLSPFSLSHCSAQSNIIFSNDFEDWTDGMPDGWNILPYNVMVSQYTPPASGVYACKVENWYSGGTITITSTETFP
jgi:hypothetical protein